MQYQVIEEVTPDSSTAFHVVETSSLRSIKQFPTKPDAIKLLRFLNLGGGFDGWTPDFFLQKYKISTEFIEDLA